MPEPAQEIVRWLQEIGKCGIVEFVQFKWDANQLIKYQIYFIRAISSFSQDALILTKLILEDISEKWVKSFVVDNQPNRIGITIK